MPEIQKLFQDVGFSWNLFLTEEKCLSILIPHAGVVLESPRIWPSSLPPDSSPTPIICVLTYSLIYL